MQRPPPKDVQDAFAHIFASGATLDKLRDRAASGKLLTKTVLDGVPGRSLVWKLFLFPGPPLTASLSTPAAAGRLVDTMRSLRSEYVQLLMDKMRAPDGGYEEGFAVPGQALPPKKAASAGANWATNNPLSLDDQNPWTEWFASIELRKTIAQDVDRTFPDMDYFRSPAVQAKLTNILFVQAVTFPEIGYRQGMHELLAPILYAVDYDSLDATSDGPSSRPEMLDLCDRTWAEADAWALFREVMNNISMWYEWREQPQTTFAPDGRLETRPYVAPIVSVCNRINSELVRSVDPALYAALQKGGVEPQIYGIRWLRLLFTREFDLPDALYLWDGLFACEAMFDVAQWVCVAMLMRIRNDLIPADYSMQLTHLLRYPSSPFRDPDEAKAQVKHTSVLLQQALALRGSPNPSMGVSIIAENRNLFGIAMQPPDSPPRHRRRKSLSGSGTERLAMKSAPVSAVERKDYVGLPEMIASRLLDTSESLGLNRVLMNGLSTVSELRKNLPDLTGTLSRTASSASSDMNVFADLRTPEERPPWEPKPRLEIEKEMLELRAQQKHLSESVGWALDVLLQGEGGVEPRKREALEALSYVRDLLAMGAVASVGNVDEDRLFGEEELAKRRQRVKEEEERAAAAARAAKTHMSAPPARPPLAAAFQSARDFHGPSPSLPRTPATGGTTMSFPPSRRGVSPVVAQQQQQQPSAPKPPPWLHTPSDFSAAAPSISPPSSVAQLPQLPRAPPPMGAYARSARIATSGSTEQAPGASYGNLTSPTQVTEDPLGVLR
ncbi:RabGAP/TBC [Exidia glandulosa HHB12029]|uniref:RabGAP/TBC n=1 Tax=Exidia glandulosa HHB12029 TaxID=1314781 RepID=A0A165MDN3_EXIGL|nr:RabGAP/TBC [Exidia glandulosa HHB12029]